MLIDSSTQTVDLLECFFFGGVIGAALAIAAIFFFRANRGALDAILSPKVPLKNVAPKTLVYRASGTALAAGGSYRPEAGDLVVHLDPRRISPWIPAARPGAGRDATDRYFTVGYEPDPLRIHTFVRTFREAGSEPVKLDAFIAKHCGVLLCYSARPDCTDIEKTYGVKFSGFVFPETVQPEPKDDRSRISRNLQAEFESMLARMDMLAVGESLKIQIMAREHAFLAAHPEINTDDGIRMLVDLIQQFIDRAKSAQ